MGKKRKSKKKTAKIIRPGNRDVVVITRNTSSFREHFQILQQLKKLNDNTHIVKFRWWEGKELDGGLLHSEYIEPSVLYSRLLKELQEIAN